MPDSSNQLRYALITGAGSGIGFSTAEVFLKKGWSVIAVGRSESKLQKVKDLDPQQVLAIACDLTQLNQVKSLVQKLEHHKLISQIRALVNNAGIYQKANFLESSDEVWTEQLNTNLLGSVRLTRELLQVATIQQTSMSIVNISSTLGLRPVPGTAAYSASKAAMVSWTKTLALEVANQNIRVNCICPGIVDTPIHEFHENSALEAKALKQTLQKAQPIGRIGRPDDVAYGAYYLCSDEASWVTGSVLNIDGGISL